MPASSLFQSFLMGGFECSTHKNNKGRRLDLISSTCHDRFAEADYQRMIDHGMTTARDGARWHLIEPEPFRYDFASLKQQIAGMKATGIEIIWDVFHYGYPDDIDIFTPQFVERFAAFARELTRFLKEETNGVVHICPVNEISFFAYIAGEKGVFYPCAKNRGDDLKQQLIRAAQAAIKEIRTVAPEANITFTDPAIHVVPRNETPAAKRAAESYRRAQFAAFDSLVEQGHEPLNGRTLDVIGLNYYFHNQWRHPSRRKIPRGHALYRPLREILGEYFDRYRLPLLIAETGIEDEARADWFRYVCDEVDAALEMGVPIEGVCLYPIVNHPGWADDRHCHNGLWDYADGAGHREIHVPLSEEILRRAER